LLETQNHLLDGQDRGYVDAALGARLMNLDRAAVKATTNLMLAKQRQAASQHPARRQR